MVTYTRSIKLGNIKVQMHQFFTLVDSNDVYIREIIGAFNDFEKAYAYQARVRICGLF